VPYELLTGNYSAFNFASGRMSWLSFARATGVLQWRTLIPGFCQRGADDFQQVAMDAGLLQDRCGVAWRPPRREMVSPKEEVPAVRAAVRSGLMSPQQAIMEVTGVDPDDLLAEFEEWNKKLDAKQIVLDTDPRRVSMAGTEQPSVTVEMRQ
jgi:capsid protein